MPRGPVRPKNLSPEQKKSATYINNLLLDWKLKDVIARQHVPNSTLAREISKCYELEGRTVSGAAVGSWLNGESIPSPDSAYAIAQFFGADFEKTFAEFGHKYHPPLSFTAFYQQVLLASGVEQWEDKENILKVLKETTATDWEGEPQSQWVQLAYNTLYSDNDIHTKARQLIFIVEAEKFFKSFESMTRK